MSSNLNSDEVTVLMIANRGESMIPIGRWETSVKSLADKGYMTQAIQGALGPVNYIITDAGRRALAADEDDDIRQMIVASNRVVNARTQAQHSVEQAAKHLADAARASVLGTGDSPEQAARRWHEQVLRRALEMING